MGLIIGFLEIEGDFLREAGSRVDVKGLTPSNDEIVSTGITDSWKKEHLGL